MRGQTWEEGVRFGEFVICEEGYAEVGWGRRRGIYQFVERNSYIAVAALSSFDDVKFRFPS